MPVWMQPVANSRPGRFISHMVRRYFAHDVGRQGAALAYYLLFTIFPFLIFLSSLLGLLDLDISGITTLRVASTDHTNDILRVVDCMLYKE